MTFISEFAYHWKRNPWWWNLGCSAIVFIGVIPVFLILAFILLLLIKGCA